jgi:multidrug efflux pump subunit AcrA (membrane-fusion protein)
VNAAEVDALERLRAFARVQVRSGFLPDATVRAEVLEAAREDLSRGEDAETLAAQVVATEIADLEQLENALTDLEAQDLLVLRAVEDHWDATAALTDLDDAGESVRGVLFFSHTDVWHAVDHGMLELNLWHGDTANVAVGDELLALVLQTLAGHGLQAVFDEGRIETTLTWQRRRR